VRREAFHAVKTHEKRFLMNRIHYEIRLTFPNPALPVLFGAVWRSDVSAKRRKLCPSAIPSSVLPGLQSDAAGHICTRIRGWHCQLLRIARF
jgi:hypothetical protein